MLVSEGLIRWFIKSQECCLFRSGFLLCFEFLQDGFFLSFNLLHCGLLLCFLLSFNLLHRGLLLLVFVCKSSILCDHLGLKLFYLVVFLSNKVSLPPVALLEFLHVWVQVSKLAPLRLELNPEVISFFLHLIEVFSIKNARVSRFDSFSFCHDSAFDVNFLLVIAAL